jgi:hypothetical protein
MFWYKVPLITNSDGTFAQEGGVTCASLHPGCWFHYVNGGSFGLMGCLMRMQPLPSDWIEYVDGGGASDLTAASSAFSTVIGWAAVAGEVI